MTARLAALRGLSLWPRHFQSSRIITEAAMHIPLGGSGNMGVSWCQLRNEMQEGEPEQDGDGERDCDVHDGEGGEA